MASPVVGTLQYRIDGPALLDRTKDPRLPSVSMTRWRLRICHASPTVVGETSSAVASSRTVGSLTPALSLSLDTSEPMPRAIPSAERSLSAPAIVMVEFVMFVWYEV